MTAAATPSSSARTVTFVVTPVLLEKAILMRAVTRPPDTVLPNSLSACVLLLRGTSVPSSGCKESAEMSCSVASVVFCISLGMVEEGGMERERENVGIYHCLPRYRD